MISPKLIAIAIVLGLILALSASTWFEHNKYVLTQADYDTFVAKSQVLAAKQTAENTRNEKLYEDMLHTAYTERDAALVSLRDSEAESRRLRLSITPATANGSDRICFSRPAFDSALQQFFASVEGLLTEGDTAVIDDQAWLKAWPK